MAELWFWRPQKPNWFQRLIQWRQIGPWSHVAVAIGSARGWEVLESRDGGVQQRFMARPPAEVQRVAITLSDSQLAQLRGWWAAHIGEAYDAVGLIEIALGKSSTDKSAWFCSEAATASLQAAGVFRFADAGRVSPQELWAMAKAREEAIGGER